MKFNEKLIKLRKTNGYTQENLAEKLGVTRQAVARWEAGETTPDMEMLLGLCQVFSVSADYLIHDDYESDEDIPVVRVKNAEINEMVSREKLKHLIGGILFAISTLCFIFAAVTFSHRAQLPFLTIAISAAASICVYQFYCYFKK